MAGTSSVVCATTGAGARNIAMQQLNSTNFMIQQHRHHPLAPAPGTNPALGTRHEAPTTSSAYSVPSSEYTTRKPMLYVYVSAGTLWRCAQRS